MKVLIAGYGSAGQYLVDFLMKDHRIKNLDEICIMSRKSPEEVQPRIDISRVAGGISERFINISYYQCDFNNVDQMASIISRVCPHVIVYTGRYASGLKYGAFSYPHGIGYGVWMPMSFPYIYNLMKACKSVNSSAKVINTSFPDGVNYLLGQIDCAPYTGAGNINHLIPRIKRAAAAIGGCSAIDISVELACAHYVNTYVSKEGTEKNGKSLLYIANKLTGEELCHDCTYEQDPRKAEIFKECKDNSAGGQIRNQMIATDCAELVRLLLSPPRPCDDATIHVPGFKGRPGGRKCKVIEIDGVSELDPVSRYWSDKDIDAVNCTGLYNDGVVIKNCKLYFTDEARYKMHEVYDLTYPDHLEISEIQDFADEISQRLRKVGAK